LAVAIALWLAKQTANNAKNTSVLIKNGNTVASITNSSVAPKRIISLAPSITENIHLLDADDSLIAITQHCASYGKPKEKIGALWNPNIETIVSLQPDLVIATKDGNKKSDVEKLQKLGIKVLILELDNNFDAICSNFLTLGKAFGKGKKAESIITQTHKELNILYTKSKQSKPIKIFWEIGSNPLFTVGIKSFFEDINKYTNTINPFGEIQQRYFETNAEEVLKRNPDVVIIAEMGNNAKIQQDYWKKFADIEAVKKNRIYVIKNTDIFIPTPISFLESVKTINALVKELK
jgi:iron complex transport system substrate-binding protein